ncbi:MAG: hypothetical protein K6A92_07415 [Lachnospiraceae bacterium]|nr:hypothetical protein [Lachnospiraceae bacterium]
MKINQLTGLTGLFYGALQIIILILFIRCGANSFRFLFLSLCVCAFFWILLGGYTRDYTYRNIRARLIRNQSQQAQTFFRAMCLLSGLLSLAVSVLLVLFSDRISVLFFGTASYRLLFVAASPILVFLSLSDLFHGLFLGEGIGIPVLVVEPVSIAVFGLCALLSENFFDQAGASVGMLLQNSDMEVAYECLGILLSADLATGIRLLFYVIFYFWVGKASMEDSLYPARLSAVPAFMVQILRQIYSEMLLHVGAIMPFVLFPACSVLFQMTQDHTWLGYYTGMVFPLLLILGFLTKVLCTGHLNEIAHLKKLDDFKKFKNAVGGLFQGHLITILPIPAFLFAAATPLCGVLGIVSNEAVTILRFGCVSMALFSLLWITRKTLRLWKIGHGLGFGELVVLILCTMLLIFVPLGSLDAMGKVMLLLILDQVLLLGMELFRIRMRVKLHMDLVEDWIKPVLCAFISAFVIFILISAFGAMFAPLVTFAFTAVVYFLVFVALLLALRCLHASTARYLPGSAFWQILTRIFHLS